MHQHDEINIPISDVKDSVNKTNSQEQLNNNETTILHSQSKDILPRSKRRASTLMRYSILQRIENGKEKEDDDMTIDDSLFPSAKNEEEATGRSRDENYLNPSNDSHRPLGKHPWYIISPR